jgi:tetratricopeptide (TPR) repeat protein
MSWFNPFSDKGAQGEADNALAEAIAIYQGYQNGRFDKAEIERGLTLSRKAAELYATGGKLIGEAKALNVEGSFYRLKHDFPKAIDCNEKALRIIRRISPGSESEGQAMNNLAELHRELYYPEPLGDDNSVGHFVEALRYALQACGLFQKRYPGSIWFGLALYHLGRICCEFGDIETAKQIFDRADLFFVQTRDWELHRQCKKSFRKADSCDREERHRHVELARYILSERADWGEVRDLLDSTKDYMDSRFYT